MSQPLVTVTAPAGSFQGAKEGGVRRFLGIRYAAAPLGVLRFRPPQPLPARDGVIDATRHGNRAYQVGWPEEVFADLERQGEESEDCLFLNVFAPQGDSGPRPVLLWIHGGAFMCGSGNDYDASNFVADNDVVVVTVNYRLGIFGFLNLDRLGPEYAGSANLGIQDQIAALRWVRENISAFGGDPSNVSIWGESAGAASVLALLGTPAAEGLFHKAMVFSGAETLAPPTDQLTLLRAAMGCGSDAECLEKLRAMPADQMSALQEASMIYVGSSLDGVVVTRPACEAIRDGSAAGVPVLAGATRDEGTILAPGFSATDEIATAVLFGLATSVGRNDGGSYLSFLQREVAEGSLEDKVCRAWFDTFRASALRVASTAALHGAGGWVYNFEVETEHALGIAHFADVPFTFNWMEAGNPGLFVHAPTPANRELAKRWSRTVAEFARSGSPNGHGLPEWPQYRPQQFECLRLADQPEIVGNPDGADMLALYAVSDS